MHTPDPMLNEEEVALLDAEPERCLRQVVDRGAIAVEDVTADLPPHLALVLRSIAAGERLPDPSAVEMRSTPGEAHPAAVEEEPPPDVPETYVFQQREWASRILEPFPTLQEALEQGILSPDEAIGAAHTIDGFLGRYPTGTRYAAP